LHNLNFIPMPEPKPAVEQAPATSPVPTITNPAPTTQLVGIAEFGAYTGTKYDKEFILRFVKPINGLDAILLSTKQMSKLAESVGMSVDTPQAFQLFKTIVGNHESEVEVTVERLLKGSTYIDRNGIVVTRSEDGVSILPQAIVLPIETRMLMLNSAVKTVSKQWTSASRFAPKAEPVTTDKD